MLTEPPDVSEIVSFGVLGARISPEEDARKVPEEDIVICEISTVALEEADTLQISVFPLISMVLEEEEERVTVVDVALLTVASAPEEVMTQRELAARSFMVTSDPDEADMLVVEVIALDISISAADDAERVRVVAFISEISILAVALQRRTACPTSMMSASNSESTPLTERFRVPSRVNGAATSSPAPEDIEIRSRGGATSLMSTSSA